MHVQSVSKNHAFFSLRGENNIQTEQIDKQKRENTSWIHIKNSIKQTDRHTNRQYRRKLRKKGLLACLLHEKEDHFDLLSEQQIPSDMYEYYLLSCTCVRPTFSHYLEYIWDFSSISVKLTSKGLFFPIERTKNFIGHFPRLVVCFHPRQWEIKNLCLSVCLSVYVEREIHSSSTFLPSLFQGSFWS